MAIYKGDKKVIALYKGDKKIIKRYKGTQVVFDVSSSDTLSFEFDGDTTTYKLNDTTYTATSSPYTTTLTELGIDTLTSCNYAFSGSSITKLISFPDTSNIKSMSFMFFNCYSLTSLDLSNFDTSNITSVTNMFRNCYNLQTLNVIGWDISKVVVSGNMFANCPSLSKLILGKVTQTTYDWWCTRLTENNISYDIIECTIINEPDTPTGDTTNNIELVFENLSNNFTINGQMVRLTENNTTDNGNGTYTYISDASIFGFGSANDNYTEAFNASSNLIEVNHLYFPNTIIDCSEMFSNCTKLQKINAEGWEVSHLNQSKANKMLDNCTSLTMIILGQVNSITYDWWYQRLVDAGIQDQVTIEYSIV